MGKSIKIFKKCFLIFAIFTLIFSFNRASSEAIVNNNPSEKEISSNSSCIILTKDEFLNSLRQLIMLFPNYYFSFVTIETIGSSNPVTIRDYLFSHFKYGYLVIAADEQTIPPGTLIITDTEVFSPNKVQSDTFYSIETLDFDKDGNYGEFYDDIMKTKLQFRFIVSRIPYKSNTEFESYFENLKKFKDETSSNILLSASFISFPNEIYMNGHILTGDGARAMEIIKNNFFKNAVTLYETGGDFPTIYDPTATLSKETFIKEIKEANLIIWNAHGSQTGAYTETWFDKNKNGLPDAGEFVYTPFISASDTFETHAIVFSASCLNLNGDNNLGKSFIKKGAVAFVGAREVTYSPSYFATENDGGSASIMCYFTQNLSKGNTVGTALYDAFNFYYKNLLFKDIEDPIESGLLNIYDFNIYGLPMVTLNYKELTNTNNTTEVKSQQCNLEYQFNVDNSTKKFTLNIKNGNHYSIICPKNLLVTNHALLEDSTAIKSIFDPYFNIIRVNENGSLIVEGYIRGDDESTIKIKAAECETNIEVSYDGLDLEDFDFDTKVNYNDLNMLISNFGKTYMDENFPYQCDLNNDLRINGVDILMFLRYFIKV